MGCACGGRGARPMTDYVVSLGGEVQSERHSTPAAARIWIAKNAKGKAATIRAVPQAKTE